MVGLRFIVWCSSNWERAVHLALHTHLCKDDLSIPVVYLYSKTQDIKFNIMIMYSFLIIALSHLCCITLLLMTSVFVTAPECLFVKPQGRARELPSTLLIHGFVTVKTWLLIVCETAFYAIIYIRYSS